MLEFNYILDYEVASQNIKTIIDIFHETLFIEMYQQPLMHVQYTVRSKKNYTFL